jgi:hypothetical protein
VQSSAPKIVAFEFVMHEVPNLTRAQILIAQRSTDAMDE